MASCTPERLAMCKRVSSRCGCPGCFEFKFLESDEVRRACSLGADCTSPSQKPEGLATAEQHNPGLLSKQACAAELERRGITAAERAVASPRMFPSLQTAIRRIWQWMARLGRPTSKHSGGTK